MKFRHFTQQALFLLFFIVALLSEAKINIPQSMDQKQRRDTLQILGPATSTRLLSSPYPLGGWDGFEVGISRHYVPMSYLSEIDKSLTFQRDIEYPILTIGKGLYYDFDLFLSIVPMIQTEAVNHFSTQIRHQFWQSEESLFKMSGLIYVGTTTLNNQLNMQSYGFDLLGNMTIEKVSIFMGLGTSFNNGRFIGGAQGITDSQKTEVETLTLAHQLVGIEWPIDNFFLAAQVDRFKIPYYSIKLGYRQ